MHSTQWETATAAIACAPGLWWRTRCYATAYRWALGRGPCRLPAPRDGAPLPTAPPASLTPPSSRRGPVLGAATAPTEAGISPAVRATLGASPRALRPAQATGVNSRHEQANSLMPPQRALKHCQRAGGPAPPPPPPPPASRRPTGRLPCLGGPRARRASATRDAFSDHARDAFPILPPEVPSTMTRPHSGPFLRRVPCPRMSSPALRALQQHTRCRIAASTPLPRTPCNAA
jgi:hypothetical protein